MALISEEEINNIRNSANIVDIISSYIPLNKVGNDYVGVCPFHDDHSPSMRVSTKLNIFKCFVCGAGGNVFSFVSKYENIGYIEAIKIVAEKSGISFNHNISEYKENKYQKQYDVMDLSHKFYQNNLMTEDGKKALLYLHNRGISDEIIKDFKFGLSLSDNKLKKFFENKNVSLDIACEVGLLNKDGIDYYDTFVNRIMIPIFDMKGNLSGYTARAHLQDEKSKYINSRETIIYKKGNILFNYYKAKDAAKIEKEIVIVEGNMDVISMYYAGIKNVVALMGVVVSQTQIEALKKIGKVVLMLDSDNAGSIATINVGNELYKAGIDTYVVRLSGSKDPDEYIRLNGVDALKDNIKHAKKFLDYKLEVLKNNRDLSNVSVLSDYIKDVIDSLKDASELERDIIISKIEREYNIDGNIIKNKLAPVKKIDIKDKTIVKSKKTKYELATSRLLYAMMINKNYYIIYNNKLGYLENKIERDIVSLIGDYIQKYKEVDISGFLDYIQSYTEIRTAVDEIISLNSDEDIDEKEFYNLIEIINRIIDENEITKIKNQIKNEMDISKKVELIERLTEIKKEGSRNERD